MQDRISKEGSSTAGSAGCLGLFLGFMFGVAIAYGMVTDNENMALRCGFACAARGDTDAALNAPGHPGCLCLAANAEHP